MRILTTSSRHNGAGTYTVTDTRRGQGMPTTPRRNRDGRGTFAQRLRQRRRQRQGGQG